MMEREWGTRRERKSRAPPSEFKTTRGRSESDRFYENRPRERVPAVQFQNRISIPVGFATGFALEFYVHGRGNGGTVSKQLYRRVRVRNHKPAKRQNAQLINRPPRNNVTFATDLPTVASRTISF